MSPDRAGQCKIHSSYSEKRGPQNLLCVCLCVHVCICASGYTVNFCVQKRLSSGVFKHSPPFEVQGQFHQSFRENIKQVRCKSQPLPGGNGESHAEQEWRQFAKKEKAPLRMAVASGPRNEHLKQEPF